MGTLKSQSNGLLYSSAVIRTLDADGWAVRFGTGGGAWAGSRGPAQSRSRCTKCNSPPINGQCTNFILFDVAPKNRQTIATVVFSIRPHHNRSVVCFQADIICPRQVDGSTTLTPVAHKVSVGC